MATKKKTSTAKAVTATATATATADKALALVEGANALQRAVFDAFGTPIVGTLECTNKNAAAMAVGLVVGSTGARQGAWQGCANLLGAYMSNDGKGVDGVCKGALNSKNDAPKGGYYLEPKHAHVLGSDILCNRPAYREQAFKAIDALFQSSDKLVTLVTLVNARLQACNHTDKVATVEGATAHWQAWQDRRPAS